MKRMMLALAAVAAAVVVALAGCGGGGGSAASQPTRADHLACRTVWRTWGIVKQAGPLAGSVWAAGMPGSALTDSITVLRSEQLVTNPAVAPALARDVKAAARNPMIGTKGALGALVPAEHDCRALGITAANAENMK